MMDTTSPQYLETQLANDIIDIALQGGIGHWAKKEARYGLGLLLREFDEETREITSQHIVSRAGIMNAMRDILLGNVQVNIDIAMNIWQAYKDKDSFYLDAQDADVIIQVACFGDIVYG
jgi:hypothetical protein